jgi:hypothetical protein
LANVLADSIVKHLSRELTYAHSSPKTMYTESAKTLANNRKGLVLEFYKNLLADLRKYRIGNFRIQRITIKGADILLLVPNSCLACFQGDYLIQLTTKKGVKCKKLIVTYQCNQCTTNYQIAFCLPVVIKEKR